MKQRTKEERAAYMRAYREDRKARGVPIRDSSSREENQRNRFRRYGLTQDSFLSMFEGQGCACAICRTPLRAINQEKNRTQNSHIDHCHTTGVVRGILCANCNAGLGQFKDDPSRLRAAIAYLSGNGA